MKRTWHGHLCGVYGFFHPGIACSHEAGCAAVIEYELLGLTNNVLRTLHVPVTAWDLWDTGLAFNWATNAHSSDAINLRHDYAMAIDYTFPECEKPLDHAASPTRNEPACWIAGTRPTIKARFEIAPLDITNATLSADFDGSILSRIDGTAVTFSNGVTRSTVGTNEVEYAPFQLASAVPTVMSASTNETWHWFATAIDGHDLPSAVSVATNGPSKVFSILDESKLPWTDDVLTNQNAWVSALAVVCSNGWANGQSDFASVASNITTAIYSSGAYQYETNSGATMFLDCGSFLLTDFLSALNSTSPVDVNCSDCARAVTSLANLAGCSLWSSRMFDPYSSFGFNTNPYCAIGRAPWNPPRWGWSFSYHEVAWDGSANSSDNVYDACLKYDGDDNPANSPRTPEQPACVMFSDGDSGSPLVYRERLTPSGSDGYGRCLAQPLSKRRYPVK